MGHIVEVRQGKTILGTITEKEFLDQAQQVGIDTRTLGLFEVMQTFNDYMGSRGNARRVAIILSKDDAPKRVNPKKRATKKPSARTTEKNRLLRLLKKLQADIHRHKARK